MGLLFLIRRYVTCEIDKSLLNKRIWYMRSTVSETDET